MGDTTGFVGLTIAFKGAFVADPTPCPPGNTCGLRVEGISRPHTIVAPEGQVLPALPASGRLEGTFAIHFTERILDDGRLVFEDLGPLVTGPDGPTWPVLPVGGSASVGGDPSTDLVAASGWIVRTPLHPCPAIGGPCDATEDYLTAKAYQPVQANGSVVGPPPSPRSGWAPGAYDAWAPDPKHVGTGVEPRPVTLMVRSVTPDCPPDARCAAPTATSARWQVVGRLDPPPFAQPVPPPEPTPLPTPQGSLAPAAAERQPGGFPTTIDGAPVYVGIDALAHWHAATDDTSFLVGGWYDSHLLMGCSPPIGQHGLDPLEARLCARYAVDGLPGSPIYPDGFTMPDGNGPIVLRVHTRDPGATRCTPEGRPYCLERTIVESVAWFGDAGTVAAPIGPAVARSMATSVFVTEWRPMAGGDRWPSPRTSSRSRWPARRASPPRRRGRPTSSRSTAIRATGWSPSSRTRPPASSSRHRPTPRIGPKCLDLVIERPAPPRWVGYENVLVLLFADDAFANRLADVMPNLTKPQKAISLTDPGFDRTLGTVTDYLVARSSGELDHAWGNRLIDPLGGDGYQAWYADVLRRQAADALTGRIEVLDETPTEARVGSKVWALLDRAGVTGSRIVRVTYDHATDPALATEDYLVVHMPASEIHDWQLIRIAGAP